jgi:hypothetical protein
MFRDVQSARRNHDVVAEKTIGIELETRIRNGCRVWAWKMHFGASDLRMPIYRPGIYPKPQIEIEIVFVEFNIKWKVVKGFSP